MYSGADAGVPRGVRRGVYGVYTRVHAPLYFTYFLGPGNTGDLELVNVKQE